jgi:hypothetical protein
MIIKHATILLIFGSYITSAMSAQVDHPQTDTQHGTSSIAKTDSEYPLMRLASASTSTKAGKRRKMFKLNKRCNNHRKQLNVARAQYNKRNRQEMPARSKETYQRLIDHYQSKISGKCSNLALSQNSG